MAPRRRRGADAQEDPQVENAPKNRPPNTAFRQQRMKAWQCVLTPKLIVTIFSILAAIYLGFGAYLTWLAHTVCSFPQASTTRRPEFAIAVLRNTRVLTDVPV
jgi:hypothetical protein